MLITQNYLVLGNCRPPPSTDIYIKEALEFSRRAMADPGLLMATANNPLGLLANDQGRLPEFRVVNIRGEGQEARFDLCARFCDFLNDQEYYIQKFKSLSHPL